MPLTVNHKYVTIVSIDGVWLGCASERVICLASSLMKLAID